MTQRKVCQKLCTQPGGCLLYNMTSNLTTSFCWLSSEISSPELFFHQLKWVSFGVGAAFGVILTIIVGCSIKKCMDCCEDDYEDVRAIKNSFSTSLGHPGDVGVLCHVKLIALSLHIYFQNALHIFTFFLEVFVCLLFRLRSQKWHMGT